MSNKLAKTIEKSKFDNLWLMHDITLCYVKALEDTLLSMGKDKAFLETIKQFAKKIYKEKLDKDREMEKEAEKICNTKAKI